MAYKSALPGFKLSLGYTIFYLGVIVLIPLSTLFLRSAGLGWDGIWGVLSSPRTAAALRLSFGTAAAAAALNAVFGFLVAWTLARHEFPGKRFIDALVDLPFALPTAVAGITLTTLYSPNGWLGRWLDPLGFKAAYTPLGITLALTFIGLPFVVRTVQPVIEDFDRQMEEAAETLGADPWTTFRRVVFPNLLPALITGFTLAFARGIGEYGSVIFISGNMPYRTEIAPLLIMTKLEQYDYAGATAIALGMLIVSFLLFLTVNVVQARAARRLGVG